MYSRLRVVIRNQKCEPFRDHQNFRVYVRLCCNPDDKFRAFDCTEGEAGLGKIYGEEKLPQGCYYIHAVGAAPGHPTLETYPAIVYLGCDCVACVSLIVKERVLAEAYAAITAGLKERPAPEAEKALATLRKLLPESPAPTA